MDAVSSTSGPEPEPDQAPPAPESGPIGGPQPLTKPPRSALTVRDMLIALAVLVPIILLVGGVTRACSFSPAGPTIDASGLPTVDAPAELRRLSPDVPYVLRIPAVPQDWRSNSVDQDRVDGGGKFVRAGYLTSGGRYLRVLQSNASEEDLLKVETGSKPVAGQGTVDVAGQSWVVYGRSPDEPIWIAEVPSPGGAAPVRMLITGSGNDDEYRALAAAALSGEVLQPPAG